MRNLISALFRMNLTKNFKNYKTQPVVLLSKRLKSTKMANLDHIVWVDLEMTGLNIDTDHIIEMACLITDKNLNIVAEGPELVIHQSDTILNEMNEWCQNTHSKSGLTQAVRESKIDIRQAEDQMVEFLKKHVSPKACPLAGNSVYVDRMFLNKYMPKFNEYLHYRIIDVSTVKELNFRWFPTNNNSKTKKFNHRALDDIKESIEELKFYRNTIFREELKK